MFVFAGSVALISEPESLGQPVGAVISQGVAFGKNEEGRTELYFAVNGEPATFYAVDAESREVTFSQSLPGFDVVWAITAAGDGNIYFTGTRDGNVYRYSPADREIQNLGPNGTGYSWVWDMVASDDGKVFGSTSRSAGVFEVDVESGRSRSLATGFTDEDYARGLGATGNDKFLTLTINRNPDAIGITFLVEVSSDLVDWHSGDEHVTLLTDEPSLLKARDTTPITESNRRFIPLRVLQN